MDLPPERLVLLLNKIKELLWYEKKHDPKDIIQTLLKDVPNAGKVYKLYEGLLRIAAKENLTANALAAYLGKRIKSKTTINVITKFWTENSEEIHQILINQSSFGNSVKGIKWRIDQLTNTKNVTEIASGGVSIVEITKKNDEKVVFEVDKKGVDGVLLQFQEIQKIIDSY